MAAHKGTDTRAAFTGLILGTVVIFALMFGIVKLTNARYAGHGAPKAEAGK